MRVGPLAALVLDLAVATLAPSPCAVRGDRATLRVEVAPAGVAAFDVWSRERPYALTPRGGDEFAATIDGPLRFRGAVTVGEVQVRRPVVVAGGMVRLSPEARMNSLRARGPDALGEVDLDDVKIEALAVPCDALTVDEVEAPAHDFAAAGGDADRVARRDRITVRARPGAGEAVTLVQNERGPIDLVLLGGDGAWARVAWRSGRGSSVTGWVRRAEIKPPDGLTMAGFSSTTHCGGGCARIVDGLFDGYRGPAAVAAGATVYAEPGRGAWAVVTRRAAFEVVHRRGDRFVAIRRVERLDEGCDELYHAWVAVEDVALPR